MRRALRSAKNATTLAWNALKKERTAARNAISLTVSERK
jgi:hypothetical protein